MTKEFSSTVEQSAGLTLADGTTWGIFAGEDATATVVSYLAKAMQLRFYDAPIYRLFVVDNGDGADTVVGHTKSEHVMTIPWRLAPSDDEDTVICIVPPLRDNDMLANQLMQLSLVIAQQSQTRGGFLLHGALIEKDGWSVILAGPGGVGKTTASSRLRSPWRSLSDDATLVVRDVHGTYWAHPWPTWSNFMSGGPGGTWDVNDAVPLKAIFFLEQAQQNRIEPLGPGHSVPLLVELAEQVSWSMENGDGEDVVRALRLQRFENICSFAKSMSCYHLNLSLDGAFWELIEKVINKKGKNTT